MRRFFLLLVLISCSITLFSRIRGESEEQIPIVAWGGVTPKECSVERFKELRRSGITHNLTLFNNVMELTMAMESAKEAGIKMIIYCPELRTEPEKIVKRFKDHPALAGYFIYDEPPKKLFTSVEKLIKRTEKIDNKHFCYVNLFGNHVGEKYWGTKTYKEYVQQFIEGVSVSILSFDHYPIYKDLNDNSILRDNWYENLEFFSNEARKIQKPFWAFALTVAMGHYPTPTLEGIRLQVFSNLAYGAQGIQYFTYWTPSPRKGTLGNFHNGPIEYSTKKKTNVYYYIQQINSEIEALSPIFLGSKVVSVAHTGKKIPQGTTRLTKLPKVIKKFETEGLGAIVSILKNGNTSYFVVINRDFQKKMSVTIEGDRQLNRVLKSGTIVKANTDRNSRISVDAGDILIFSWES